MYRFQLIIVMELEPACGSGSAKLKFYETRKAAKNKRVQSVHWLDMKHQNYKSAKVKHARRYDMPSHAKAMLRFCLIRYPAPAGTDQLTSVAHAFAEKLAVMRYCEAVSWNFQKISLPAADVETMASLKTTVPNTQLCMSVVVHFFANSVEFTYNLHFMQ